MPGEALSVVGGQPLASGLFGLPALPMLPVHLSQLRATTASAAPQWTAGRLAPDGAVRLRLRALPQGAGARAAFSAGNEVGDPGPFRATELSRPNVDRIGPQYFAETHLGTRRLRGRLGARFVRHYTTDARIVPRVSQLRALGSGPPLQELAAARLEGALYGEGAARLAGRPHGHVQYASLRALPFFPTLAYEVPAQRTYLQAGVQNTVADGPQRPVRYRVTYTRNALASDPARLPSPDTLGLAFDWTEHRFGGDLSARVATVRGFGRPVHLRLGLSADHTRAALPGDPLADPAILTTRAYARLAPARTGENAFQRPALTLLASQTDGQVGGGALLSGALRLGARRHVSAHLAAVRTPYAEDGPFWYWLARGLPAPQAFGTRIRLPASFPAAHRLTADLRFEQALPGTGHAALELGARHLAGLSLTESRFTYDTTLDANDFNERRDGGGLVPDIHVRTGARGQTFRAALEVGRSFPRQIDHRLRYDVFAHRAQSEGGAGRAFAQRFLRTPRHRLRYTARLQAYERFSLEGRFTLRGPERWPAYAPAARAEGSAYRSRLPTYALLDVTATKRLWKDHLHLRLALRNALDAEWRTHPAGPVQRLTLFVSLEAQL